MDGFEQTRRRHIEAMQAEMAAAKERLDAVLVGPVDLFDVARRLSRALEGCGLDEARVEVRPVDVIERHSVLEFADRGIHDLKGVPGIWRLFRVS